MSTLKTGDAKFALHLLDNFEDNTYGVLRFARVLPY